MTGPPGDLSFRATPEALAFWIHVTPRARRDAVGGTHGDALRVAVRAPPAGGAANRACVQALAAAFAAAGVRRRDVELDPGSRGRRKRVRIRGDGEALRRRLVALAGSAGDAPEP